MNVNPLTQSRRVSRLALLNLVESAGVGEEFCIAGEPARSYAGQPDALRGR